MPETYPQDDRENFDRRMAATGWPEWVNQQRDWAKRYRLRPNTGCRQDSFFCVLEMMWHDKWQFQDFITDHEADCLIERHRREWLEAKGYAIHWVGDNTYEVCGPNGILGTFIGYDAAQGSAIDAVMAEMEKEDEK